MAAYSFRRRLALPLGLQMLGLLVGVLIVAQCATLALTVLIPPASPQRWDLEAVARMLLGHVENDNLEIRAMKGPPDISGSGWLVSETSREALARRLGQRVDHVVLAFYTQLPVGGVTVPAAGSRGPMALSDPEGSGLLSGLVGTAHAQGMRGGPLGGGAPGNGFPGGGFPGGGFPGGGFPGGGFPGGGHPGGGVPGGGIPGGGVPGGGAPGGGAPGGGAPGGGHPGGGVPGGGVPGGGVSGGRAPGGAAPVGGNPPTGTPANISGNIGPRAAAPSVVGTSQQPQTSGASRITGPTIAAQGPGGPGVNSGAMAPSMVAPMASLGNPGPASAQPAVTPRAATPLNAEAPAHPSPMPHEDAPQAEVAASSHAASATPAESSTSAAGLDPAPLGVPQPIPFREGSGVLSFTTPPFIEGDFVAAMRQGDGTWIAVAPRAEPFPNRWQKRVMLWFVLSMLITVPLALMFARRIVKPLEGFARAAEVLGRDPSANVVPLSGPAEVGRAARAFNQMRDRLRAFVDDRTAMVGAISHDLRTPLTRLRFRLEDVPDEQRDALLAEVDEMEMMISQVIAFIREASTPGARQRLDLATLVADAVEDARVMGDRVRLDITTPIRVEVDPLGIRRLLGNLLENALKYGQQARVRVLVNEQGAVAEIVDNGPGIPQEDRERAFEPFFRCEQAIESDKPGSGLGLAVCRSIARAHGGDVLLEQREEGFVAKLVLPTLYDDIMPKAA
ncbi:ATP-binding protein [Novosphingobium sediminicola]|uniref:histidine kinase n=1 Tax=Novosphingobium sediminicola TaxID=563162 RepID=A0A7W6CDA5_9SPHN|nr:ATP-binding protein [Novosphingobium sediminicola]MBB3954434.1 signal transduction histidine kinase [Novosphingobium sediminicola]